MVLFINALLLVMLVQAPGVQKARDGQACRAELKGQRLLTTYELPDGTLVEGPWQVVHTGTEANGQRMFTMFAVLEQVIEKDGVTGNRKVIQFPSPVRLTFEGPNQRDLVHRAAQVWCVTVLRAQENQALDQISPTQTRHFTRITAVPRRVDVG